MKRRARYITGSLKSPNTCLFCSSVASGLYSCLYTACEVYLSSLYLFTPTLTISARLMQSGIDHFHPRIAQRQGDNFGAAIVPVKTRLGDQNMNRPVPDHLPYHSF
jgi:hypothetical protein